jgi:hypothetical protein
LELGSTGAPGRFASRRNGRVLRIFFARALDFQAWKHYIKDEIVERERKMAHLLGILILGTIKIAAGAAVLWILLQVLTG